MIWALLACNPVATVDTVTSPVDSVPDPVDTQDSAVDWPMGEAEDCAALPENPGYGDTVAVWVGQDDGAAPAAGQVVVSGSSSIRRWESAQSGLAAYGVVQRGFGGAQLWELAHHAEDLILRHEPAAVLVYAGTNDLSAGRTPEQVLQDARCLGHRIWSEGRIPLIWVGITPNPARWEDWSRAEQTNALVQAWAGAHPGLHYVDTAGPFLETGAPPQSDLFDADQLHLSPAGYALWDTAIQASVAKILSPRSTPDTPQHPDPGHYIRVDLGPSNAEDGDRVDVDGFGIHWNSWHSVEGNAQILAGEHLDDLVDTLGVPTGMGLVVGGGFRCNGKLNGGLTQPSGDLLGTLSVPEATGDYFYVDGLDNPGALSWLGLDPTRRYTLRLFASRDSEETRVTRYTVAGQSQTLQTSGSGAGEDSHANTNTVVVFTGLQPDAWGALHLDVAIESGPYAYLSLMELEVE